ncbi:hypothetical protein KIN20_029180 [Parelaphostrongylus tenuis]|uniref:Uncharacterized protein n=1 Tax=Parelaphostrongylus tenuis TaxID=148309 RepID=A0AAD5R263_PARTN|nr:hypothetical protein KIN20_029180 [Parelaphostrongylus tenuis]
MERVLDIENIFDDVTSVVACSSRDAEAESPQISKARWELSSRLATIFADDHTDSHSATSSREAEDLVTRSLALRLHRRRFSRAPFTFTSNSLTFLVFYNSNKENLLCVPLGVGKIHKIEKQEKYCTVTAALKTFTFLCLKDEEEAKLIALLMILCSIESTVLEVGSGDEVVIGSSISYSSTRFTLDGATVEVVPQQPSKYRLSQKTDSSLLIHVNRVKSNSKKQKEDISKLKIAKDELSHHPQNIMTNITNIETSENEDSLHSDKDVNNDTMEETCEYDGQIHFR